MTKYDWSSIDYMSLVISALIIDFVVLCITRYSFGKPVNNWYNKFGINAIIADIISICIGISIGFYLFWYFEMKYFYQLVLLCLLIQIFHDILFYYLIIKPFPKGHNDVIDVFKDYSTSSGMIFGPVDIIFFDSLMILLSLLLYCFIIKQSWDIKIFVLFLVLYSLTFIQFTRNKYTLTSEYKL